MSDNKVLWQHRCAECDEQRVDWLVWAEDGDHVECQTCGNKYQPDQNRVVVRLTVGEAD